MQKPFAIRKYHGRMDASGLTDGQTDRHGKVYNRVSATNKYPGVQNKSWTCGPQAETHIVTTFHSSVEDRLTD